MLDTRFGSLLHVAPLISPNFPRSLVNFKYFHTVYQYCQEEWGVGKLEGALR